MAIIVVDGEGSFTAVGHRLMPGKHETNDPALLKAVINANLDWVYVQNPVIADLQDELLRESGETPIDVVVTEDSTTKEPPVALQDPDQARASKTVHLEGPANQLEPGPLKAQDFRSEYVCPECSRSFQNSAGLASHRRARHTGVAAAPGHVIPTPDSGPPTMPEQTPPAQPLPQHPAPAPTTSE